MRIRRGDCPLEPLQVDGVRRERLALDVVAVAGVIEQRGVNPLEQPIVDHHLLARTTLFGGRAEEDDLAAQLGRQAGQREGRDHVAEVSVPVTQAALGGTLTVPIDWDDPDGETIDLALARIPASDPDARIGSLVINPGGPGGSGVGFALFAPEVFSPEVLDRFDIVGFDPRGVGDSHPVLCSVETLQDDPGALFDSRAELDARAAFNDELREDCRENTGPLYDHVDSLSVVHDIDAIRAALGDEQLSFFGVSYGTLMGQQYAATYPERVRAVVEQRRVRPVAVDEARRDRLRRRSARTRSP
jgi:hypothetical protein